MGEQRPIVARKLRRAACERVENAVQSANAQVPFWLCRSREATRHQQAHDKADHHSGGLWANTLVLRYANLTKFAQRKAYSMPFFGKFSRAAS